MSDGESRDDSGRLAKPRHSGPAEDGSDGIEPANGDHLVNGRQLNSSDPRRGDGGEGDGSKNPIEVATPRRSDPPDDASAGIEPAIDNSGIDGSCNDGSEAHKMNAVDGDKTDPVEAVKQHLVQHRSYLVKQAKRVAKNTTLAEDLVQETCEHAIRNAKKFCPGTNPRGWFTKIMSNLFIDHIRHEKVISGSEGKITSLNETLTPFASDLASAMISDAQLSEAIQRLPSKLREVVELCYLQQMTYKDAALKLRIPIATVGTRLMKARERLMDLLTPPRKPRKSGS